DHDAEPGGPQPLLDEPRDALLVLGDEHACHGATSVATGSGWVGASRRSIGMTIVNRDPAVDEARLTRPPCACAIALTMGRPSPEPLTPRPSSTRPKRSKMRSSAPGGMPSPWSSTHSSIAPSRRVLPMRTVL